MHGMRLFSSKNKSNASIDRSSRSNSPEPSGARFHGSASAHRDPYQVPVQSDRYHQQTTLPAPAQQRPPNEAHYQQQQQQQQQDPQIHTHPAHVLSRGSSEAPYAEGRRPSQPTLNLVPPISPPTNPAAQQQQGQPQIAGQTQFGPTKQVHVAPNEKEHKRSKRSIFGLSSKDKDKENSPTEKKGGIGRSGSIHILRKHSAQQPSQDQHTSPQSPGYQQQNVRQSAYFGRGELSQENIPENPDHYEQYQRQQAQQQQQIQQQQQSQQQQGQYDSPHSQTTRQSPDYVEDTPHYSPQDQQQYQAYQQQAQDGGNNQYVPYRANEQGRPSQIALEDQASLRPPSQASLGPPSPLIQGQPDQSRPSTAATSRYSTQSVAAQQLQAGQQMAGDRNGGGRRDRDEEHRQYQQDPRARMSQQVTDQGRSTPPPRGSNKDDPRDMDYNALLQRHEELQAKYSKVKRYYFEREAQVTQLQNTVANQRLSLSKTSLDDSQYASRFERLGGAINNLAFNIRKDWKDVPPWLRPVCNRDAHTTGTKEMTAVGRACVTRWVAETVFDRVFHPSLPRETSMLLKYVEKTLRRQGQSGLLLTDEQRDDLTTKITTWRLTTIEGLADSLNNRHAPQIQEDLIKTLTDELTNSLKANLNDPPPVGLQEGVSTIVQQAVSIAANIPLESRDICIEYFMPGEPINETYMRLETGMTSLANPGQDQRLTEALRLQREAAQSREDIDEEGEGERDVEAEIREAAGKAVQGTAGANGPGRTESLASLQSQNSGAKLQKTQEKKGSSFLGGFVSKKPPPGTQQSRQGSTDNRAPQPGQQVQGRQGNESGEVRELSPEEQIEQMRMLGIPPLLMGEGKVRFAAGLAVEVRGKMLGGAGAGPAKEGSGEGQSASVGVGKESGGRGSVNVLYKAPVYEL